MKLSEITSNPQILDDLSKFPLIQTSIVNFTAMGVILDGLLNRLGDPDQVIDNGQGPYLHRWYLIRNSKREDGAGGNLYLHKFLRDDYDRALHDHPWQSVSIILSGEYDEVTESKTFRRKVGDIVFREAEQPHRICLIDGKPVYTLFATGPKVREWGFHCEGGWKHNVSFELDGGCE